LSIALAALPLLAQGPKSAETTPVPAAASFGYPDDTKVSQWQGFDLYEFKFGENAVKIAHPKIAAQGKRWVWKAVFFGAFPAFDKEMLERGWHVAHISVGNTFGCPSAMQRFDAFYAELTTKFGFHQRPVLEGLSRGGLYVYNWAANNTDKVGAVYADNAVCDFKSWPGGKGKGKGSPNDWNALFKCYNFASEAEALAWNKNPVDNVAPLVKAGIPLVHSFGDADDVVPWEENTKVLAERVQALGGKITLFRKPGMNHHPHGPLDPKTFADWVLGNALTR
jgi:pimeloyl-ACP methyl ester carboxylesterase